MPKEGWGSWRCDVGSGGLSEAVCKSGFKMRRVQGRRGARVGGRGRATLLPAASPDPSDAPRPGHAFPGAPFYRLRDQGQQRRASSAEPERPGQRGASRAVTLHPERVRLHFRQGLRRAPGPKARTGLPVRARWVDARHRGAPGQRKSPATHCTEGHLPGVRSRLTQAAVEFRPFQSRGKK